MDECHHLSAVSFEAVARAAKAKYVVGLSATVTRKDGHHPIIFMQCGPIRYRVDARRQAAARPFSHQVVIKRTAFHAERQKADTLGSIQELYGLLACDAARNDMIFNDVLSALEAGRSPVVITERKDHLQAIAERLTKFAKNVIVLKGGMGAKQRNQVNEILQSVPDSEERVIVATGRYLGEGFDDARLDTLFLTMPISWRGTLAQYAGRLHRLHAAQRAVIIFDYVDKHEPTLLATEPLDMKWSTPPICFHSARCDEKPLILSGSRSLSGDHRPSLVPNRGAEAAQTAPARPQKVFAPWSAPRVRRVLHLLSPTTASYDGSEEDRPGTARVARNAYPLLRPSRPIDSQFGANFACVTG